MDKTILEATKQKLMDIAEVSYEGEIDTAIAGMSLVIPDIQRIVIDITDETVQEHLLKDALVPILDAMESKDATAMGDRISYELIPIIDELG